MRTGKAVLVLIDVSPDLCAGASKLTPWSTRARAAGLGTWCEDPGAGDDGGGSRRGRVWAEATDRGAEDAADGLEHVLGRSGSPLAELVREIVHPDAELVFDTSRPDGMPRKVLDVSRLHDLGWKHSIELREGLEDTYRWFVDHYQRARGVCP